MRLVYLLVDLVRLVIRVRLKLELKIRRRVRLCLGYGDRRRCPLVVGLRLLLTRCRVRSLVVVFRCRGLNVLCLVGCRLISGLYVGLLVPVLGLLCSLNGIRGIGCLGVVEDLGLTLDWKTCW